MKQVAIVKTFMRPELFKACMQFLIAARTDVVLVAFDGPSEYWDEHRKIVYEANQRIDAEIFRFPYDYGLSACRNRLIELISEPYFLMIDDDIMVTANIWDALPIMQINKNLAAATFGWLETNMFYSIDAWDVNIKNGNILSKTIRWPKQIININGFVFCFPFDFVPNQGFWSRKFFDDFRWDEHYIIEAEHEDIALHAWPSKWQFAVCLNVFLYHMHDREDSEYENQRFSQKKMAGSWTYFFKKWNLKEYRDGDMLLPYISPTIIKKEETIRGTYEKWKLLSLSLAQTKTKERQ